MRGIRNKLNPSVKYQLTSEVARVVMLRTLLGVLAMALLPASSAYACSKKVRWYDDAPYSFRGQDGQVRGFDADLTRAIMKRMGCRAVFVELPWARALSDLEGGRLDILPGSFRSAQRETFAYFSNPSLQSPNVLFIGPRAAATYRLTRLDDLADTSFRLGVQIGVSYGDKFESLKSNSLFRNNLVPVTLRRNAWQMMALGRIDGMIADEASAAVELEQLGLAGLIKPSAVVVSTHTSRFAFSKRSVAPQFITSFNNVLQSMIANGEYRSIRARYLRCPPGGNVLGCT